MNPNICNCPYTNWCGLHRQKLQESFRQEDKTYKVVDCEFYKVIKKRDKEQIK